MTRNLRRRICCLLIAAAAILVTACGGQPAADLGEPKAKDIKRVRASESRTTFVAVGDIMLSRGVAAAINRAGSPDMVFKPLEDLLLASDFNFGNLESPVSGNDSRLGKGLVFNARADHASVLSRYKFNVLNLANNHALDQGVAGLRNTRKFLDEKGLIHLGTGDDLNEAWKYKVYESKGVRIAFIGASYASINDGGVARNDYVARIEDHDRLAASVRAARDDSDLVVVTMHAGIEYVRRPEKGQIEFAHAAIDAGADIVIGAHPHWPQIVEEYKGRMIYYSLGNFVFDQRKPETKKAIVLKISVVAPAGAERANIESIEVIPVVIDIAPRRAPDGEARSILASIGVSEPILRPKK